ncbi:helix-turn-helix domain-containing protein [Bradyrhizobium sp. LHD-71]|uniref:helix-turn-helix domain-containing protein n=1 Tax=Bradyrhizobium sp. LHD-71 TaxID=3072141 RepID=UPI00280EE942|nr:helix-turn-helix domain-containing protein [Bradyrhizobium sp. LHD-71]MDQ8729436.1 helix-turn-helix domain-containing protein [Bradyrhizobium sp. LHD-71]
MTMLDLLQQARKARLQRIASRAVAQTPSAATTTTAGAVKWSPPAPGADRQYERAWAVEILGASGKARSAKPAVSDILRAVARHYDVRRDDLLATRRTRDVVRPRQVAMYLARQLTAKSFPEIARSFRRDHATVIHAARTVSRLLAHDDELAADIARIREMLED